MRPPGPNTNETLPGPTQMRPMTFMKPLILIFTETYNLVKNGICHNLNDFLSFHDDSIWKLHRISLRIFFDFLEFIFIFHILYKKNIFFHKKKNLLPQEEYFLVKEEYLLLQEEHLLLPQEDHLGSIWIIYHLCQHFRSKFQVFLFFIRT